MSNPIAFYIVAGGVTLMNTPATGVPTIRIAQFKLGSAVNYQPEATDVDIRGTLVYSGNVTSVTRYDASTIRVTVQLPSNVGPFLFGEIGLYTDTGVLFALCSYPVTQDKLEVGTSGIVNPWTISALIQSTQGTGIFFLSNAPTPNVPEYPDFTYVSQASGMVGNPNTIIVHEATADGKPILLTSNNDDWAPVDWTMVTPVNLTSVGSDTLAFSGIDQLDGNTSGRYLIGNGKGSFVPIQSIFLGTGHLPRPTTWINTTDTFYLYEKTIYRANLNVISSNDVTQMVSQLNTVWSTPQSSVVSASTRFGTPEELLPYYGYGQPTLSSISNIYDPISWQGFIQALTSCAGVLGLSTPVSLTGFSGLFLNSNLGATQLQSIRSLLAQITRNRLKIPLNHLEFSTYVNQITATNNLNRIHYDVTATFADSPSQYAFFNSGGCVCFQLEDGNINIPGQTYLEYAVKYTLSQLGTIRFHGLSCESLGQIKVKGRGSFPTSAFGSGYQGNRNPSINYTSESTLGFYGLTIGLRSEVFSYVVPLGTDGSSSSTSQILEVAIYATRTTATAVKLECWVNIMAYSDYVAGNFTVTTPRQTTISVYQARASSTYMSVNYPTLTNNASNW